MLFSLHGFVQSQALNAQLEGTVNDANNASLPNLKVIATNIDNGVTSDDNGGLSLADLAARQLQSRC